MIYMELERIIKYAAVGLIAGAAFGAGISYKQQDNSYKRDILACAAGGALAAVYRLFAWEAMKNQKDNNQKE